MGKLIIVESRYWHDAVSPCWLRPVKRAPQSGHSPSPGAIMAAPLLNCRPSSSSSSSSDFRWSACHIRPRTLKASHCTVIYHGLKTVQNITCRGFWYRANAKSGSFTCPQMGKTPVKPLMPLGGNRCSGHCRRAIICIYVRCQSVWPNGADREYTP